MIYSFKRYFLLNKMILVKSFLTGDFDGTKYSRVDEVNLVEDSLQKIYLVHS